jgi:acetyltransferase-like isoleucine patch superfamily enzyme
MKWLRLFLKQCKRKCRLHVIRFLDCEIDYAKECESVGRNVRFLGQHIAIHGGKKNIGQGIHIGDDVEVYDLCQLYCDDWDGCWLRIGNRCHFNFGCYLCGSGGLTIGDDCLFGPGVKIIPMEHCIDDSYRRIAAQGHKKAPVLIGNDVHIGAGAVILSGVAIGTGAVIGANAVVTHDVDAFSVVGGVPARLLRMRGQHVTGVQTER